MFVHRWLGFISGLVVFIVSITGCLFVFQDDIQDALYSYRHVGVQNKPYVPPAQLRAQALKIYPKATSNFMNYYGKDRPVVVGITMPDEGYRYVYYNPYNGKLLHDENYMRNFFVVVEYIHLYLLLPPKIGGLVVGISVIIFVILMITGIVLWWPKRKSDRKRSFTIKWNGRWRRVNYDLHNVLGFYSVSIALILAISGLAIAFDWMRESIYTATNLGNQYAYEKREPRSDSLQAGLKHGTPVIDQALRIAQARSPQAQMFSIYGGDGETEPLVVTAYYTPMHYYRSDEYVFDKYTGKQLKVMLHQKKSPGMKMNDANYDIHVGQLLGFPGKVIAFLASLLCASLPVTGFIIWLGKRKKKKRNPKIRHHQLAAA